MIMPWLRAALAFLPLFLFTCEGGLQAQTELRRYEFDPARSQLYVVTHRSGLLSFLGHEHVIVPPEWSGTACWTPETPKDAHASVTVDARTLVIDSDSGRAMAGLGRGLSPDQVRTIQRKLLDAEHLDVATYPELRLEIAGVNLAGADRLEAQGRLTIRGVTREVRFPVEVAGAEGDGFGVAGVLTVRQSDFGIRPESIAGVVRVSDQVGIHFNLAAAPTGETCP